MRILIAEDSEVARRLLAEAVSGRGHDCVTAPDGLAAWQRFEAEGADIVIADWAMPGIDGDELCRRIRAVDGPYVYFIIFTSFEDKSHLRRAMEAGADDYVTKPLDREELEARLVAASRVIELHRRLDAQQAELERLNAELHEQARRDPLTGLFNRLALHEDLEVLEERAKRYRHGYGFALCDVDRFKAYNDALGHSAGDETLRAVARAITSVARRGDGTYRYGGEEMLVVLVGLTEEGALAAAERLRSAVADLGVSHPGSAEGGLTVSVGIAVCRDGERPQQVLDRADAALYAAKRAGRDRVELG